MTGKQDFEELIEQQLGEVLSQLTSQYGLTAVFPTADQIGKLAQFSLLLESWTQKVDLIAPATPPMLVSRHIVDSAVASLLVNTQLGLDQGEGRGAGEVGKGLAVLDVGSGAGLPGIVFAILAASNRIFLCEPREKRSQFLEEVKRQCLLPNVTVLRNRVEKLSKADVAGCTLSITRATGMREEFLRESARLLGAPALAVEMLADPCVVESGVKILSYRLPPDDARRILAIWRLGSLH